MATLPSDRNRSTASSPSTDREPFPDSRDGTQEHPEQEDAVSVELLVEHLLAAKRSLSSMQHVLRANDLATHAQQAHEDACVLRAQTALLQQIVLRQWGLLKCLRRGLKGTYDAGKNDFASLVQIMDATNEKLQETIDFLRATPVERAFRPDDVEQPRNLVDFVDEQGVHSLVEALKKSLSDLQVRAELDVTLLGKANESQGIQTSFDGDLLRFDNDMRALKKAQAMIDASTTGSPTTSTVDHPLSELLMTIVDHSHCMAQLLSSLTKHFDLCVTAVRTTEGGADLARRMAAETTQSQEGDVVSISGVMADQESQTRDLEPITSRDRTDMLNVVVGDASEVEGVVFEISDRLRLVESDFAALTELVGHASKAHTAALNALELLEDIGGRLGGYAAAEAEFMQRWEDERITIYSKLDEMEALRGFYQGYAQAYDTVLLEAERRRLTEEKMSAIWRRAKESIDKLVEADSREREAFRQDVAEFIPTDLWPGMDEPVKRWKLAPVVDETANQHSRTPVLSQEVVDAARDRLEQRKHVDD